jgi:uncharacterized repeat protein (TIGR02059 family)
MRKILAVLFLGLNVCFLSAQEIYRNEGAAINNTTTGNWEGVNIPRSVRTTVSFLNNSITSINASGYLLQAGDEGPMGTNNNLDGAVITGNKLTWNGTDQSSITHGMFLGYNINYTVRYNYLDKTPYGILFKSGSDGGSNMTYSSGYGAAYNIVRNAKLSLRMKGINGVQVYNNTFYCSQSSGAIVLIDANHDRAQPAPSTGAKIKNNIFYTVHRMFNISIESACLSNFESDYNIFYCEEGAPMFSVGGSSKTFSEWQALGYDQHSVVVNPRFNNTTNFVPAARLDYGTNLGSGWQIGMSTSAAWIAGTAPSTTSQNGSWQVGAIIYPEVTTPPVAPDPVYVSSSVENNASSVLEMVYNMTLAAIVPAPSSFTVNVNSVIRNVNSVSVSGTKVLLTLASPVIFGDVVTVSYTKPSANPIQTSAGKQAASIANQTVTNKVAQVIPVAPDPVYVSSSIENTAPSVLGMVYDQSLAAVVPATSAFKVTVSSVTRNVNSVSVSGTKVLLTLASPVIFGDAVTVSYTKPQANQIQTSAGKQAASIVNQPVTNNVAQVVPPVVPANLPPVAVVNVTPSNLSGFVGVIDATGSYDPNNDNLTFTWTVPENIAVSSVNGAKIQFLSPVVITRKTVEFTLRISDGKTTQVKSVPIEIVPYKPELEVAEVLKINASGYQSPYYPYNILDGNIGTMWSVSGDNHWLRMELKEPFNIKHVKVAFQSGQKKASYFDLLASNDTLTWDPILTKSASCGFSGDLQVFEFPEAKAFEEYRFIKVVGHSNSVDAWNYISEFKIFGYRHRNTSEYDQQAVKIYPNPAHEVLNIRIDKTTLKPDFIKIINLAGKIVFQDKMNPDDKEFQIPIDLRQGIYIVQIGAGDITLFTQKLVVNI